MIIKLNSNGGFQIEPQTVPENINNIYVEYVFPKGLNHMEPILIWGEESFKGDCIYISKQDITNLTMRVELYNNNQLYRTYRNLRNIPDLYIGYNLTTTNPNILKYIQDLENENKFLREQGDIL